VRPPTGTNRDRGGRREILEIVGVIAVMGIVVALALAWLGGEVSSVLSNVSGPI
jgi:hypothetical protein